MPKPTRPHKAVGPEYLTPAIERPMARHVFKVPASAVWAALRDGPTWSQWLPITKVTWTSPEPFGVGTTRTVEIGEQVVNEYFYAWEEGRRMAFRFTDSSLPVSAGAEDYTVVPNGAGCEFLWSGKASAIFPLGGLITGQLRGSIAAGMPKLEALILAEPKRFGL